MRIVFVKAFVFGCGLLVTCELAHADITFTLGNNPPPGNVDVNIVLDSGATGTLITGSPADRPELEVDFTSSQVLLSPSSGQSRITANPEGTPLTNLMIFMANRNAYSDLIFNLNIGGVGPIPATAAITVQPVSNAGILEPLRTFDDPLNSPGQNFLTITTSGGEFIAFTSISVPTGVNDLRQARISGPYGIGVVPETPVPEPDTLSLLGFGITGFGLCFRKLRRRVTNQISH